VKEPPSRLDNFHLEEVEGIKIYVKKTLRLKEDTLRLDLYSFLFVKEITVEGVEIL